MNVSKLWKEFDFNGNFPVRNMPEYDHIVIYLTVDEVANLVFSDRIDEIIEDSYLKTLKNARQVSCTIDSGTVLHTFYKLSGKSETLNFLTLYF